MLRRLWKLALAALAICASVAGAAPNGAGVALGVPGRYQYDNDNGYCGEVSIQMLMLGHGAWIPQEVARDAGGGELLPGVNYDRALRRLGVAYEAFDGRGYDAFMAWTKRQLLEHHRGVVTVAYYDGGPDADYDHIMPIVGWHEAPDGTDSVLVHTGYATRAVPRRVGGYSCTARNKKDSIDRAGCVPKNTRWGYAIAGRAYAAPELPRVSLRLDEPREPGVGRSETLRGRLRVRDLVPGVMYRLLRVTDLDDLPNAADLDDASPALGPGGQLFEATGSTWSTFVTFPSRSPVYFIVTEA